MKFIRKIVAMIIFVVFFTALVISLGFIFAIKNINVKMLTYADEETYTDSYNKAKEVLSIFKGESIVFLDEEELTKIIADNKDIGNYTVDSCEKIYPCTVNVVLRERLETFAVESVSGDYYNMYDSDGKFLRYDEKNNNVNDGTPNVEIKNVPFEMIEDVAIYAAMFKDAFGSMRSIVASISVDTNPVIEGYVDKLYFNLRSGLKIQIDNYLDQTEQKIKAVGEKFATLTDRQKLNGTLRGYRIGGEEGIINADYSPL